MIATDSTPAADLPLLPSGLASRRLREPQRIRDVMAAVLARHGLQPTAGDAAHLSCERRRPRSCEAAIR